jgi:hypothetical protein
MKRLLSALLAAVTLVSPAIFADNGPARRAGALVSTFADDNPTRRDCDKNHYILHFDRCEPPPPGWTQASPLLTNHGSHYRNSAGRRSGAHRGGHRRSGDSGNV